jgi:hypothetical protein
MSHGPAASFFQGQARLCAIQSLNLALFIYTQHYGVLRGIEIQADDIGHLLQKPGMLGAVRDWAILADQKGPNCYDAMATRMSPAPTEF